MNMARNTLENADPAEKKSNKKNKKDKKSKKKKKKVTTSSSSASSSEKSSSSEELGHGEMCEQLALQLSIKPKMLKLTQFVRMDDLSGESWTPVDSWELVVLGNGEQIEAGN